MSHIIEGDSGITHIPSFKAAVEKLAADAGVELKITERDKPRFFGGRSPVECDFVVNLPGRYDLGIRKNDRGEYVLHADNELLGGRFGSDSYGRNDRGRKILGEDARNLLREYQIIASRKALAREGMRQRIYQTTDGSTVIEYED